VQTSEYSEDYGKSESRFVEAKVQQAKAVDLGPRIVLDDERCILCTRCIRFTRDIAGDDALGHRQPRQLQRAHGVSRETVRQQLHIEHGGPLPVGALTSKDFRFQMRVWFLKEPRAFARAAQRAAISSSAHARTKSIATKPRETTRSTRAGCAITGG